MTKWEIGNDGWPTSPLHPANLLTDEEWREQRFQSEMRACKAAVDVGNILPLERALGACRRYNKPLPLWLERALVAVVQDHARSGSSVRSRGRTGNPFAAYQQNQIHYERWAEVEYVRTNWATIPGEDLKPLWKKKPSLEEIFDIVSVRDGISAETVKKSYQLVERETRSRRAGLFVVRK